MVSVDETSLPAEDIRPIVGSPGNDRLVWVFAGLLALAAIGLFVALEERRAASMNAVAPSAIDLSAQEGASPPELVIPQGDDGLATEGGYYYSDRYPQAPGFRLPSRSLTAPLSEVVRPPITPRVSSLPSVAVAPPVLPSLLNPAPFAGSPLGPAVVYQSPEAASAGSGDSNDTPGDQITRTHAGHLANPADTVPEGTVIQAVMETALDSSRAGFTRAVVSRDIRGFDGSQVLIPRGSRLYGEYQADVDQGQGRALIRWQRLLRPDGVTMHLDSPATDPLGRAGVKGHVNSHFLARFGGAIMQSVLNIGVGLASRPLGNGVYVNLPQGAAGVSVPTVAQNVHPTLTIPQGTSISVYVAHDLDFSGVTP